MPLATAFDFFLIRCEKLYSKEPPDCTYIGNRAEVIVDSSISKLALSLLLPSEEAPFRRFLLLEGAWLRHSQRRKPCTGDEITYLVVVYTGNAVARNSSPFSICTHPEGWMDFVFGDHFAYKNMTHEEIVIHRLCDNLRDRRRLKLDETVMFRPSGLHGSGK